LSRRRRILTHACKNFTHRLSDRRNDASVPDLFLLDKPCRPSENHWQFRSSSAVVPTINSFSDEETSASVTVARLVPTFAVNKTT
jgi:hypothetical protein